MKTWTIRHGNEFWLMNEAGEIQRDGDNGWKFSSSWRVLCAVTYSNHGNVTRLYTLKEICDGKEIPWAWKNGTQRTFVRDYDHGTIREWRHPRHSIDRVGIER